MHILYELWYNNYNYTTVHSESECGDLAMTTHYHLYTHNPLFKMYYFDDVTYLMTRKHCIHEG